jgi:hypothetical protein
MNIQRKIVVDQLANNKSYIDENSIPRQKKIYSPSQSETSDVFGFKWQKRDTYESREAQVASQAWLKDRYDLPG